MKSELERVFDGDMLGIYKSAKKECGDNALVSFSSLRGGGIGSCPTVDSQGGRTDGFTTLWENHRLDLSVEANVLKPEYESLFSEEERRICRDRLEAYGYNM